MSNILTTEEFAKSLLIKPESLRHAVCIYGHYHGIKPIKLPNRRLAWLEVDQKKLLGNLDQKMESSDSNNITNDLGE